MNVLLLKFLAQITCLSVSGLKQKTIKFHPASYLTPASYPLFLFKQTIFLLQWKGIKLEGSD